jgi:eukaryotic-like serine/threonine-protein kinase
MTQENPFERYTILRELGRGAIGTVHAARDRSTGAAVALKVLDPALFGAPNAELAKRFLENARSAARLRHNNIVRVLDAGEAGGTAYVAMELVEGESLRHMLDERPLSVARAIRIFDDIASALAYAHEEGMVHRGVKPSNIMILPSGVAKIGDFGTGQIGGTALRYMSPEQVRRDPVDARSDLFSLGAVFYEMLTHRAPFDGSSTEKIRESILRAKPPPPSRANPHVPGALDAIVSSLLAARPDDRPANARILLRDLQRLEEGLGMRSGASAGTGEPAASVPPRDRTKPAPPQPAIKREPTLRAPDGEPFYAHDARFIADRGPWPEQPSGSRTSMLAALALMLAMLSIGLTVVLYYSPASIDRLITASRMQEAPATAAAPSPSTSPPPVTEAIKEPASAPEAPPPRAADGAGAEEPSSIASAPDPSPLQPPVAEPSPSAPAESLLARESEQSATGASAPSQETPRAAQPTADVPKSQPGGKARLIITVSPQGELYIDGKHHGTTPPITTLDLEPGIHRIEIHSGSRTPYLTYMMVEAGDERRIRYDFNAKPIRPPG